jgi:hypothetical protein
MSNTIEVTTEGDTIITVTPEGNVTVGVAYNPVAGSGADTNLGITRTDASVTVTSSTGADGTILAADSSNAGVFTSANFTKLAGIEAGADVTDLTNVGAALTTATAKSTIIDADLVNIQDSAASFAPKTTLWSLVKSTLKTYFDTLYPSGSGTSTGTNTGDQNLSPLMVKANNLSDLTNTATARTNLGLGTLATQSGTFSGTSSGTNTGDQDLSPLVVKANNLSDLTNAATARTNLGLGTLATQSGTFSGTSSGTNTGDQTNISGNAATVTTNANLTGPVTSVGNATAIAAGAITNTMLANGAVANLSGTNTGDQSIFKNIAVAGQSTVVADTTNDTLTLVAGANITLTTDALTDTVTITASGGGGGGDVVGPASATNGAFALFDTTTGKLLKNGSVPGGAATLNVGTSAGTVAAGDDSRFTNARTPTAHASTHVTGGSDAIQSATSAQNGLATSTQITKLDGIEAGADVTDATNVSAAGAVMKTLADAKGDLFAATAADTVTRLPIGVSNGHVLTVDSAETTGMKWAAPSGSGGDVVGPASSTDNAFARFDSTTGKLLQNSTATLNDVGLAALDGVQFSTTPTSTVGQAKAVWDATDSCLSIGLNASVNALVGTDSHVQVYNESASTMTVMQVVRQSGSSGTRLSVELALANTDAASANTIGIVAQTIASNAQGFIQTAGLIQGVNTNAFTEGDILWLSATTAGLITNVKPTAPNHGVRIGYCIKKAGGAGIILIDILNGFELDELHDVEITTPVADNSFLSYNATSSVWENKLDVPATQLTGTINNARLPATITGLTSVTSTTFVGSLTGTASGNATLGANTFTGAQIVNGSNLYQSIVSGSNESYLRGNSLEFYDASVGFSTLISRGAMTSNVSLALPTQAGTLLTNNSNLAAANLTGTVATARLGSGTASSTTYLRGDSTFVALPTEIQVACSDETTVLTTGIKLTFRMPYAMTLTNARISVTNAPTVSSLIVDVRKNGTTIFSALDSQKLIIVGPDKFSSNPPIIVDSALTDNAEITVNIIQVGSSNTGLKLSLIGTRA